MVIFTTSGSSGRSKLVVYSHRSFGFCCQAWKKAGLFSGEQFGNTGFSPLFTHTIGIRTFINCLWSGNPFIVIITDWFLNKPAVVRYFLLEMHPAHIIGGPAFFNTLLELFRQFPELKTEVQHTLKAAISIGAPFDITTSVKFKSATGVKMMNGFGTTETLMISLNENTGNPCASGNLLPGVTIGLKRFDANLYELAIRSLFQSERTIGESAHPEFFETGDLAEYNEGSGQFIFYGRKTADFLKDEYGVKIPLNSLKEYYRELYDRSAWIEWIPLVNIPGLAALIFTDMSENIQKELAAIIKFTNEELKLKTEPFEYAHRHLERFVVINDEVPLTRKGTVSKDLIIKRYDQLIAQLRNPFVYSKSIEVTETGDKSDLFKFSNPYMAELLEALKIDREYTKAEGDYLFFRNSDSLERVTDFVGGFGANLLGHNHPEVRGAVRDFLDSGNTALNDQGSNYYYPSLLARSLNHIFGVSTGKYFKVLFASSGTEAAELAIHHAWFEWRIRIEKMRDEQYQLYGSVPGLSLTETWENNMKIAESSVPCVLVANNCFHGYTSGSRSLLNRCRQRDLFSGLLKLKPLHVSDNDEDWKDQLLKYIDENFTELQVFQTVDGTVQRTPVRLCRIIASVIEPVRGEGGIRQVNQSLADFLSVQEFPLISDEIQCGLGRTGNIVAYPKASYYLLGKSLGGGIEKISAVLIDDTRFRHDFTKYFNSTFANGGLAAATALRVLKIIIDENVPAIALKKGNKLIGMLRTIAGRHPEIIRSIEGRGLMVGIHFNEVIKYKNVLFRILWEQELIGYLFAGWLLNNYNIRVLPSLSRPNSLRIEPSYLLAESEMERLCTALEELCIICSEKKMYRLFLYLMNSDQFDRFSLEQNLETFKQYAQPCIRCMSQVGFEHLHFTMR